MPLTRDEWIEMWETLKKLEDCVLEGIPPHSGYKKAAIRQIEKIKKQIQSVIGQME